MRVKRAAASEKTATRSIYFYRVDAGADPSGKPRSLDMIPILNKVQAMPFSLAPTGRYSLQSSDESLLCVCPDEVGEISKIRFGTIRRNALPQAESFGELKNLILAEEEGLCEVSHVCVFPDGIIGIEFNFYGPRASRLSTYLSSVGAVDSNAFTLESLLRSDISERLQNKKAVRRLELRVRKSYAQVVAEANEGLGKAFDAAATGTDADSVGIILAPEPYKRANLAAIILDFVKRMVGREDLRENAIEFKASLVDDTTGKVDEINLLEDQLISRKAILRLSPRSRVLKPKDAYAKILEAYKESHRDLLAAASVGLGKG